jgi:subtilisin family serine protease
MSSSPIDRLPFRRHGASAVCVVVAALAVGRFAGAAQVDPALLAPASDAGEVDALLVFDNSRAPGLAPLRADAAALARRIALVDALQARADHDQRSVRAWLDAHGIVHRDFWIANVIEARIPQGLLAELTRRSDIARITANPHIAVRLPGPDGARAAGPGIPAAAASIAWGVAKVEAPAVWATGFTGQGVVIGGEDTGYQWDHPALKPHYRGWDGTTPDHNYNWHDAVHDAALPEPVCIVNSSLVPCDPNGHGTHTAGTFAGDDGAGNQIGVAPGAKWIGCRNMDKNGTGTPARYIECMQWMLAPTDLTGANARPDLGADIVSNSWSCPEAAPPNGEGCTPADILEATIANLVAGGIFYVVAAQNYGFSCSTINDPPAIYDESFDVGATDSGDALAEFSSRGPVGSDPRMRPDLSAPGVSVYSSYPTDSYAVLSGTSMATPHVAGVAALLLSAFPSLLGRPDRLGALLRATATTSGVGNTNGVVQSCGGTPITQWPNYMAGYGRVDAWNAYHEIIFLDDFDH